MKQLIFIIVTAPIFGQVSQDLIIKKKSPKTSTLKIECGQALHDVLGQTPTMLKQIATMQEEGMSILETMLNNEFGDITKEELDAWAKQYDQWLIEQDKMITQLKKQQDQLATMGKRFKTKKC